MLIISLVLAAALFVGFVRFLEATSIYYPSRDMDATPRAAGLSYEDVFFVTEDGVRLHGWFMPHPSAKRNLLYFHGNAGNMSGRVEKMAILHGLGFNIFIFDYRGYGRSQGRPSEEGLYRDGRAAFDALAARRDVGRFPIILYGTSIGGAVAMDVAVHRKPAAVVTEAAFTSARDMARLYYPWVPGFLLSLKFESDKKIARVACPKLVIHSRSDEIVPFALGEKLSRAAAEPKQFLEIEGGHNDGFFSSLDKVREKLVQFLSKG